MLVGAWKLHLLELSGSKSSRTTSLQNFRVWKVGKNKYLQGRTRNSVREKCGKWQNWEILPYLKIPKKISDRFSLKNVYVSVLVFSVKSKNLNIGCTARFGEIKQEKIVIATSGEKTIAHVCSGKTPGSSARARSNWWVRAAFVFKHLAQNHNSAKPLRLLGNGNH